MKIISEIKLKKVDPLKGKIFVINKEGDYVELEKDTVFLKRKDGTAFIKMPLEDYENMKSFGEKKII